jgi:dolichol-phosphate mannosyltransferase
MNKPMKTVVIIPTYNEAENISKIIPAIAQEIRSLPNHNIEILVVDGHSPDGTAQVVTDLQKDFPFVHLLMEQEKRGLGAAYVFAFRHAMNQMNADVVVEMDADFQHDPKNLPALISKLDEGYDYVIGSRFTRGGSIPKEWAFYRKFLSWGGNIFSKIVLGIYNVNDFTSGFKASRVHGFVDKMDLDGVLSKGFAYKIDLLYKMHKLGARIAEVPISFGLRDRGDSKMEKNNFIDSFRVVLMLRMKEHPSFFKFVMVGFAGLATDTLLFNILRLFMVGKFASLAAGFVAMFVTFSLNNLWSFKHDKITSASRFARSIVVYYGFSYIPIIFRSYLIRYAEESFGRSFLVSNIAFFIGIAFGLVWNYTIYSRIIWSKRKK